jgi:hypothetical protein
MLLLLLKVTVMELVLLLMMLSLGLLLMLHGPRHAIFLLPIGIRRVAHKRCRTSGAHMRVAFKRERMCSRTRVSRTYTGLRIELFVRGVPLLLRLILLGLVVRLLVHRLSILSTGKMRSLLLMMLQRLLLLLMKLVIGQRMGMQLLRLGLVLSLGMMGLVLLM